MEVKKKTIPWIDSVKLFACILVVFGHLFQGLEASGIIIPNGLYRWFISTIYYFHVPLFFICSGYLHQIRSEASWTDTILKKAVTLGVPYFVFSVITWLLKTVFSGSVNHQSTSLFEILFIDPESPYWYLYALFFLFVITPPFFDRKNVIPGLAVAIVMKLVSFVTDGKSGVFLLETVLANELWFVLGMVMCKTDFPIRFISDTWRKNAIVVGFCFLAVSILISCSGLESGLISAWMGLLGCAATILLMINIHLEEKKAIGKLLPFTMPIFLMHTIFAAGLRIVMMKLGCYNVLPHIVLGAFISCAGPVLAARIMKLVKLDIVMYPGKYIRF